MTIKLFLNGNLTSNFKQQKERKQSCTLWSPSKAPRAFLGASSLWKAARRCHTSTPCFWATDDLSLWEFPVPSRIVQRAGGLQGSGLWSSPVTLAAWNQALCPWGLFPIYMRCELQGCCEACRT